ncbi:hypothetical protein AMTR_s00001p00064470 [Amborella trichopoda]|uniref:Flavin-containing monooxygenase n=1 Tax=Amborella trichopoda TaxID=13333 RepID=W1NLS1_AMBTC|nr:hypothetical protein AMTR_s00001p00064470 [Amborella trichopoda]
MHATDYSALEDSDAVELVRGKRVAVVGSMKSALDIATDCANVNGNTPIWLIPQTPECLMLLGLLFGSHFFELTLHKPGDGFFLALLTTLLTSTRWVIIKIMECYLRWKLPLKKNGFQPKHSFQQSISACVFAACPQHLFSRVEEGSIFLRESSNWSFCEGGLRFEDESRPLDVDLVILATGSKGDEKLRDLFVSPKFKDYIMGPANGIVPLYREVVHPRIPQLVVIEYSEDVSNMYMSEMLSRWLCHFIDGSFRLPPIREMDEEIRRWEKHRKTYAGKYYSRSCVASLHIWHNDQLCRDMGCSPWRKKGLLSESSLALIVSWITINCELMNIEILVQGDTH